MNIKFNDNSYPLKTNIYNKPVDGYLYKGNVIPSIPSSMKEIGVIETEMGYIAIVRRKRTPMIIALSIVILLSVGYIGVLSLPEIMGDIRYKVCYNQSMTWDDGKVDINLVNGEVDVQVSIQGDDFLSAPITVKANESLVYYPLDVVFPTENNHVQVIYSIEGKDYMYDAKVKAISFGEKVEDETTNEQGPPVVDEVIVE